MGLFDWLFGPKVDTVEVSEVRDLQSAGAVVYDVREPHEWADGSVPGARLVPMGKLEKELSKQRGDRRLLFVCRTGRRAARATGMATRRGLAAANVRGGMVQWTREGLPVKKGKR